jgi:Zn-dependent peptidase ImmA (M78 family)
VALPRGFVTEVQRVAVEERRDLGLQMVDPLDPWDLAALHGVRVIDIGSIDTCDAVTFFTETNPAAFSGAILPYGHGAIIIENGSHAHTRRVATVTHEMAHVLLEHPFHDSLSAVDCTGTTGPLEAQAERLACELLVPRPAALTYARQDMTDADVAEHLGISEAKARQSMNLSGARRQVGRERARRGR